MQLRVIRITGQQRAVLRLRQIIFVALEIQVREITLRAAIPRIKFHRRQQFRDGLVILSENEQDTSQLHVGGHILRMHRDDLAQNRIGLGKALPAHIDVRQAG